jgi:hypothetical protein
MKAINFLLNFLIYMVLPFIFIFILSLLARFSYYNVVHTIPLCIVMFFYNFFIFIALCIEEDKGEPNPLYIIKLKKK